MLNNLVNLLYKIVINNLDSWSFFTQLFFNSGKDAA